MKLTYQIDKFAVIFKRKQFYKRTKRNEEVELPKFFAWDCTRRCNLHCEHCGASKENYNEELSTNEIKKVIDDISKIKRCFFGATGGEPFMRGDILEVLSYAKSKGLGTGIASNGFLIDEKKADDIKNAKIDSIQISLDGLEETHNKIRNNLKSFARIKNAIKNLQKIKIPVLSVATTLTPHNFHELDKIYDLLIELEVKRWRISVVMPIGRAVDSESLLLSSEQFKNLFEFINLRNNQKMHIYVGENIPFLADQEEFVRDEPALCPVGITACCIGVNGSVRGCPEQPDTPEFTEGNIRQDSILNIWQKGFKKYRLNEIINSDEKCHNCKDKFKCYGGCSVMRIGGNNCIYELTKINQ
ncbi:MAG: radical SAM protein [Candidatus Moranbacteria bacterium]|nr:radical SAM protein [Candidatus Moranbacteria bacterium]